MDEGPDADTRAPENRPWLRNHWLDTGTLPTPATRPVTYPKHDRPLVTGPGASIGQWLTCVGRTRERGAPTRAYGAVTW